MLKLYRFPLFVSLILVMLACSRRMPATPAAPLVPTVAARPTGQPVVPTPLSSLDPRALDTAGMEECALLADADFSTLLGQTPADQVPEAEVNKTACYYTFSGGQTVYVTLLTGQPGKEAYDSRMQYVNSAAGAEALSLGEIAILQEQDGLISIQAVVNGWYLAVEGRGFDRQAVIALARLFEGRLIPYPQQVAAEPTAPVTGQEDPTTPVVGQDSTTPVVGQDPTTPVVGQDPTTPVVGQDPTAPGDGQCQNPYYPIVHGTLWEYRLSGVTSDTFTRALIAVHADGFTDQDTFGTGAIRTGNWACQNGNLIALTPSGGPTVNAAGMQFDFTVESNDGITFPADPQPGQTWTQDIVYLGQQSVGDTTIRSRNVLKNSCKAGNLEMVNVPAGEFQALRVDCTTQIDIYISGTLALTLNSTGAAWHAPGVGLVKSSSTSEMGPTEIVLLTYSIP